MFDNTISIIPLQYCFSFFMVSFFYLDNGNNEVGENGKKISVIPFLR